MSAPVIPVLISGGRGTRLWPLSRRSRPKQFHSLAGDGTLVQETIGRLRAFDGALAPVVVCNVDHVGIITDQLTEIGAPPSLVVAEPVGRHTAAAIAAAALACTTDGVMVVLPADHVVADVAAFHAALAGAVRAAADGLLVTFGVVPDRAETGYGYIEALGTDDVRPIVDFVEKPDAETAAGFLDGRHFWNSGMFVFRPDVVLAELTAHVPGVVEAVRSSLRDPDDGVVALGPEFERALAVPFDVAVMEKTDRAAMVPLDAGWDDVGSWRSLWAVAERDGDENGTVGDVVTHSTHRAYLHAGDRTLVVLGLDDVVVVDTADVVFVASMQHAQDVRDLVARLEQERPDLV